MKKLIHNIKEKTTLTGNKKKVAHNIYWALTGKIVNVLSGLFVGILVARYLGPEQYGLMNYVISYVTLFSVISNFGLDNIEIRELSKKEAKVGEILGTAFRLRLLFAAITIIIILVTVIFFEADRFTRYLILLYSSSLICQSFNVIRNYFTSIVLNEYIVKTEIFRTVFGALLKVILLIIKADLIWFVVVISFDFVLIASGYIIAYKKKTSIDENWAFDKNLAKLLIKESFPLLLSGSAVIIYQKIDQVIIRNLIDNYALGQFSVASKLIEITLFIPIIISQTITPILVKHYQSGGEIYAQKRLQFLSLVVWSAVGLAVLTSVFSKPMVLLLFSAKYYMAIPVLQIMCFKTVFVALATSSGQIMIIEGKQKYAVLRNLLGCAVSVMFNYTLIPKYGIVGSAWATIITTLSAGYLAHLFIPPYFSYFKLQNIALVFPFRYVYNRLEGKIFSK